MKTYINGQRKSADTEMATKYQLSRAYTKVQTHINTVQEGLSSSINLTNTNLNNLSNSLLEKQQNLNSKDALLQASIAQLQFKINSDIQAVSSYVSVNTSNINNISSELDINVQSLNSIIDSVSAKMQETDQFLSSNIDIVKNQLTLYINERDEAILNQANANLQTAIDNLGNMYELKGFYTKSDNTIATSIADLPLTAEKGDIYFITNDETGQTQQYICVQPTGVLSNERWQKFGTSVDLRKYATTGYVDDNVNLLKTKCESISSALKTDITDINSNLNTFISDTKSELEDEIALTNNTLNSVSGDLTSKINTNISSISILVNTISQVSTSLNDADASLNNKINAANDNISVINTAVNQLSTAIDNTNASILTEKANIINTLTDNDNAVSAQLKDYIDSEIENLGTVYELKGFYTTSNNANATSIDQLPTSAKMGQIYFIQNIQTGQTEQYVCISGDATLAANKWQKFGTNVDLSNYFTAEEVIIKNQQVSNELLNKINQVSGSLSTLILTDIETSLNSAKNYTNVQDIQTLADSKIYTDQVSGILSGNILQKINGSLDTAKNYANTQDTHVLTDAKAYTDQVSGILSGNIDDLSGRLTHDIAANAKEYTNLQIANLITIYCPKRKLEELNGAQPDFGTLSGNTTYKFTDPLQSLTVDVVEDSDLQTLVYFTTAATFVPGIPLTEFIDNGIDFTNLEPDTKYLLTVRNSIGKIEKIKSI